MFIYSTGDGNTRAADQGNTLTIQTGAPVDDNSYVARIVTAGAAAGGFTASKTSNEFGTGNGQADVLVRKAACQPNFINCTCRRRPLSVEGLLMKQIQEHFISSVL